MEYSHNSRVSVTQVSIITFNRVAIGIFPNGYYVDQRSIFLDGYLAWAEMIGEKVPQSFYPVTVKETK